MEIEQTLFVSTEIQVWQLKLRQNIITEIANTPLDTLVNTPVDEFLEYLREKYEMVVPTIDRAAATTVQAEGQVPAHAVPNPKYGQAVPRVWGTIYTLSVPYTGDQAVFYMRPSYNDMTAPTAKTDATHVFLTVAGHNFESSKPIDDAFDKMLDSIERHLTWLRSNVEAFRETIPQFARPMIEERRRKLLKDRETGATLKYPLRQRHDAPPTYAIPQVRKKIVLPPALPSTGPSPTLSEDHYRQILKIIESMTFVMEQSPRAFSHMGEEDIRVHYLVQLNGQYEGGATGETFNYRGKTDIIIKHEGTNIFLAECKFWDGPQSLHSTINQMLGYTTWRDTKTAIILFSRRRDFTAVVTEAARAMSAHQGCKTGPTSEGETRFRYVFKHPEDQARDIVITLLRFNVPQKADDES
jgi:hypothetical protein